MLVPIQYTLTPHVCEQVVQLWMSTNVVFILWLIKEKIHDILPYPISVHEYCFIHLAIAEYIPANMNEAGTNILVTLGLEKYHFANPCCMKMWMHLKVSSDHWRIRCKYSSDCSHSTCPTMGITNFVLDTDGHCMIIIVLMSYYNLALYPGRIGIIPFVRFR